MPEQMPQEAVKGMKAALKRVEKKEKKKFPTTPVAIGVVVIIVIAVLLFSISSEPPQANPCENGIQDAEEDGIDCGGPCSNLCPPQPYVDDAYVLPTSVSDIAVDSESNRAYVLDMMRHRIMMYDLEFNHLENFGETREQGEDGGWYYESGGITNDKLLFPASIYLANDKVYVLDRYPRIQVFSKALEYEATLNFPEGTADVLPKLWDTPNADGGVSSIAVSQDGRVYVSDEVSNAIAVFDSSMNLEKSVSLGEENSPNMPRQIALDSQGHVILADAGNHEVKVFDSELNYIESISSSLLMPVAVAPGEDGSLIVLDTGDEKLKLFEEGSLSREAGGIGEEHGKFYNPVSAKLDSDGKLYVLEEGNNRIQVFGPELNLERVVNGIERRFNVSFTPFYPAISPNGDIAFSDPINSKVFVVSQDYALKRVIGGKGFDNSSLNTPKGLAFDSEGRLFVSDPGNNRVQVFSPEYAYERTITHEELIWPLAISVSESGETYVVDDKHKKILIFDQAGNKTGEIGEEQGITLPLGLLAKGGKVYITDDLEKTIEVFDSSLNRLKTISDIDAKADAHVEFNESLALDAEGNLLFCDNRNRHVITADLDSEELFSFGEFGSGLQELSVLEVASNGEIIVVADMEQHRVRIFGQDRSLLKEIKITGLNP